MILAQDLQIQQYFEAVVRQIDSPVFEDLAPRTRYQILKAMYFGDGVYEYVGVDANDPVVKPLRNPTSRIIEFYADVLWPGTYRTGLKPIHDNKRITKPLRDIWNWSNWDAKKQYFARWFALLADGFIKIEQNGRGEPYLRVIDPELVHDWSLDERGFITFWRMEVPTTRVDSEGVTKKARYIEIWEKGRVRIWREWKKDESPDMEELDKTRPDVEKHFVPPGEVLPDGVPEESVLRFDFVPVVHAPFKIVGEKYGHGAITSALEKVHEANRQSTTLAARLYRYGRPDMALQGTGTDALGRPLPPPEVDDEGQLNTDTVDLGTERLWKLPAGWTIGHIVAPINYAAALSILQDQMNDMTEDMPEMAYGKLFTLGSDSGKAIRYKLFPAISRAREARANGEAAMVRAFQMALTIGKTSGVWTEEIGLYENDDFDMSFPERDIIPLSIEERADLFVTYMGQGVPPQLALKWSGHTAEQVEEFIATATGAGAKLNEQLTAALAMADKLAADRQAKLQTSKIIVPGKQ